MKKLSLLLIVASVLAGCTDTPEPVQSVDWYKEHKAERVAMIDKCNANPGELAATPNCVNARSAQNQITFGSKNFGIGASAPTFKKKGD